MEYQKITNFLSTTSDNVPRFITKKWVDVHDHSGHDRYKPSKQIRFKTSMLRSDLCDFNDAYIVVKRTITVTNPNDANYKKKLAFKNNPSLIIRSLAMLKIYILQCLCTICLNTAKIIQKQQEVFRITTEMNQIVV